MFDKYLFISQSDLSMQDSNGRTLSDYFGFLKCEQRYSFCTKRNNPKFDSKHTFCIDEKLLFKKKNIHREGVEINVEKTVPPKTKILKNPLTCLLRNFAWNLSFPFWKFKLKKWLSEIAPNVIVFNSGDFIFLHKLACFIHKYTKAKFVIFNTEDYSFKTWNYLHDERGYKFLYPMFRKLLVRNYNKSFGSADLVIHNTKGLCDEYSACYKNTKQIYLLHPSVIKPDIKKRISEITSHDFYYCGNLDKQRDVTICLFSDLLTKYNYPGKIIINGPASADSILELSKKRNIVYCGCITYSQVLAEIDKKRILLSVNSLNPYHLIDKKHGFSTKISDYISSLNLIFHIGLENDEFIILKNNELAYLSKNAEEIERNFNNLVNDVTMNINPFIKNQYDYASKNLNFENTYLFLEKEIKML